MNTKSARIRFTTARQVFEAFPDALDIQTEVDDSPVLDYLRRLMDSETPEDAVAFCALMLPKREAIWWACQCIRTLTTPSESERKALDAAESWVRDPDEKTRRSAGAIVENSEEEPASYWVALAAFLSGGSIVSEEFDTAPPAPDLTGKAVYAAILAATGLADPAERITNIKRCIEGGIRFAEGGDAKI